MAAVLPGSGVLGIMGGGQLGRMTAIEARRLGLGVVVLDPQQRCPAAAIADTHFAAPFDDIERVLKFAAVANVVTVEFENIPAASLEAASTRALVAPAPEVLRVCQNREREKLFLKEAGFPHAPFSIISSPGELTTAVRALGFPCVLKTADFGYDGRGQFKLTSATPLGDLWSSTGAVPARFVLESWIDYSHEISVICARDAQGKIEVFPTFENIHTNHILDFTVAPARISEATNRMAVDLAKNIADRLGVAGLIAVEMFVGRDGCPLVNEIAPRPHNSGHLTIEACETNQFAQHVRAVCGMPLGSPRLLFPAAMVNLLGDLWTRREPPDWSHVLSAPNAALHLYGKTEPRPGRKMGHITCRGDTPEHALELVRQLKLSLQS